MPHFKHLFSPNLLARRLTGYTPALSPEFTALADQWARTAADPAFLTLNEKPLQGQFLSDIFARLLGFTPAVGHLEAYHLKPESASTEVKGARAPDARLGFFGPAQDITRVVLDERLVEPLLSTQSVAMAIEYDWTIAYGAISPKDKDSPRGCELSSLVK